MNKWDKTTYKYYKELYFGKKNKCNTCKYYGEKGNRRILTLAGRCRKRAPTIDGFPVVIGTNIACGDWEEDCEEK